MQQDDGKDESKNIQVLLGGFETKTGEQVGNWYTMIILIWLDRVWPDGPIIRYCQRSSLGWKFVMVGDRLLCIECSGLPSGIMENTMHQTMQRQQVNRSQVSPSKDYRGIHLTKFSYSKGEDSLWPNSWMESWLVLLTFMIIIGYIRVSVRLPLFSSMFFSAS